MNTKPLKIKRMVPEGAKPVTAFDLDQCRLTHEADTTTTGTSGIPAASPAASITAISKALSDE